MASMSHSKVAKTVEEIFEMTQEIDVVKKSIEVNLSDLDKGPHRILIVALNAQLSLIRAKKIIGCDVVQSEMNLSEIHGRET